MNKLYITLAILAVIMAIVTPLFLSYQVKMIFPGIHPEVTSHIDNNALADTQALSLTTQDVKLEGWKYEARNTENTTLLLYFGGNAENVANLFPIMKSLNTAEVVAYNYRGYGNSEGSPSQKTVYADALKIFDTYATQAKERNQKLVVMGRSLGSAVAGYVAAKRQPNGLILVTPLSSIRKIAQSQMPWLPMGLLLAHPLDLYAHAPQISAPTLAIIAQEDEIIPNNHSLETFGEIQGNKKKVIVPGFGHGNIFLSDTTISEIKAFLAQ